MPDGKPAISGLASTWNTATVLSGPSAGFGKRVPDTIEGRAKLFIAAWLKANGQAQSCADSQGQDALCRREFLDGFFGG